MIRAVLALLLALWAAPAPAQAIYKWVDERGVTHFSESPPPDGKAQRLEVKPVGPEARPDNWKERELEQRQRRTEREIAARKASEEAARTKEQRTRQCRKARDALETVTNSRRVYNLDDKGERVYLEDKDRPAEIARWAAEVESNCR